MKSADYMVHDLYEIGHIQGEHTGRWNNEFDREESSEEYLEKMITYAEQYNIKYDKNLENYRYDDDEFTYELQDRMGFEILEAVKKYIINELIKKMEGLDGI